MFKEFLRHRYILNFRHKPTEKETSTALEKLATANDLEKNDENTETSFFKRKILCAIDHIKEKKKRNALILTPSMIIYLGRSL